MRRKGNVTADPLAPRSVQATNADYAGIGFDRGGLVRPSDVATSQDNMDSALHFTVTTPQRLDLNRRLWAWIEDYSTDQRAPDGSNRVFVIRGPAYLESGAPARGRYLTIGVNRIPAPTHFFEILAVQKAGGPLTLECFMAPNVDRAWDGRQAAIDTYRVTRVAIERATGLKFFGDRHVSESACR